MWIKKGLSTVILPKLWIKFRMGVGGDVENSTFERG